MLHSPFVKGSDVVSQAALQLILNAVVEGVCGLDAQGNATFCNDALLSMTGYLARAGGSEKLLRRLFQVFLSNLPTMRTRIQTSIASQDPAAIQHAAHTLRGSAGLIGAQAVTEAARDVEMMAKSGKRDGLEPALDTLDHELTRLAEAIAEFHRAP
jgi:HPt (histidine-containing phosphotransfer) domain-containing protein